MTRRTALLGGAAVGDGVLRGVLPLVAEDGLQFALDERLKAGGQDFQRLADAIVVGLGHDLFPLHQVEEALAGQVRQVDAGQLLKRLAPGKE
jgi:hypothetical protein